MIARTRRAHFGWLLAALLQLLLPAAASVADARAEADALRTAPRAHVEAAGAKDCARVHSGDCALCRLLATTATAQTPASLHVSVARFMDATVDGSGRIACIARYPGDPPQRAPPA